MKLNWGWGILIFILLFIAFILNFVYRCSLQRVDLVSDQYYENELKFQQQIEREKNTVTLGKNIHFIKNEKNIILMFPTGLDPQSLFGEITFFKPDDARLDFNVKVSPESDLTQRIDLSAVKKGWWDVKVTWNDKATSYFSNEKILID